MAPEVGDAPVHGACSWGSTLQPRSCFGSGEGSRLIQGLQVRPGKLGRNAGICFRLQPPGIPKYLLPVAPCVPGMTHVQGSLSKLGGLPSALHLR